MVITWNSFLIYLLQSRNRAKSFSQMYGGRSCLNWHEMVPIHRVFSQNIWGSTFMWAQTWPTRTWQQQVPVCWNVWENFLLFVCKQKFEITFVPVWSSLCTATFKKHNKNLLCCVVALHISHILTWSHEKQRWHWVSRSSRTFCFVL